MSTPRRRWPLPLQIITAAIATCWLLRLLPRMTLLMSCGSGQELQPCSLVSLEIVVYAIESLTLLALLWAIFYIAVSQPIWKNEWKVWILTGVGFGIVGGILGAILFLPYYTSDLLGTGVTPPGIFSVSFLHFLCTITGWGFFLGLLMVFPITRALHSARKLRVATSWKGSRIGTAIGFSYSVFALGIVPFLGIALLSIPSFQSFSRPLLSFLDFLRPLPFYLLPGPVILATPFSPIFDPNAGAFLQVISLPRFVFFHVLADTLLLGLAGWCIGWAVGLFGKRKKK